MSTNLLLVTQVDPQTISIFRAIVIGIVQGLTEFLPISSTAHVKVVPVLLGWGDPGVSFTAVIQLGSIAAILWYFWDDLYSVTRNTIKAAITRDFASQDFRIGFGDYFRYGACSASRTACKSAGARL